MGAHLGDWLYWQETGRHIGYEAAELTQSADSLVLMLMAHWPWVLALLGITALVGLIKWVPATRQQRTWRIEASLLGVILATVLIVRGGPTGLPQGPHEALRIGSAPQAVAALNGAYAALYGLTKDNSLKAPDLDWLTLEEANQLVASLYPTPARLTPVAVEQPVAPINVVMVLLEGWSTAVAKPLADGTPVTPNFNVFAEHSLSVDAMISGGSRTTEGMFSTFCSYQNPLGRSVAQTQLAMHPYDCLPHQLSNAGWQSAFFQGSHEDTSGTGSFAQGLGFQASYGKDDIEQRTHPENYWGVYDEDLYRFVIDQMDSMTEPMLVGINTNTTHDRQLSPGSKRLVEETDSAAQAINVLHLADHELGDFLTALEARDWQHPWMVVLVADHTSRVDSSTLERYTIPFALHAPGLITPQRIPQVAHQRDIAPTVLDIIGLDMPHAMGISLLQPNAERFAEYYSNGSIGWISGDTLLEFSLSEPQQAACYRWRTDPLMKQPEACTAEAAHQQRLAYALTKLAQHNLYQGTTRAFHSPTQTATGIEHMQAGNRQAVEAHRDS
ncbi:LTA synthase family protein [Litchfieldella xinjiangensis]|uniref:LTA synthase family protein n=1 Tax=Litchfieldella xinjiangensis TaxID=1166948 RepID=UPI0018CD76B7|nr:LTA synthase family protein [Halomonas xinjiangensis]